MSRKHRKMILFYFIGSILFMWGILTFLAQRKGSENMTEIGNPSNERKALIVYNPDLFYHLDLQICFAFAEGLSEHGWHTKVATVVAAENLIEESFHLYIFCANTYNWAPDIPTKNYIENHYDLKGKNVVAITLGSGSTERAQRILETSIMKKGANLIDSKTYWLMRPNDDSRTKESNIEVGVEMARKFGHKTGLELK